MPTLAEITGQMQHLYFSKICITRDFKDKYLDKLFAQSSFTEKVREQIETYKTACVIRFAAAKQLLALFAEHESVLLGDHLQKYLNIKKEVETKISKYEISQEKICALHKKMLTSPVEPDLSNPVEPDLLVPIQEAFAAIKTLTNKFKNPSEIINEVIASELAKMNLTRSSLEGMIAMMKPEFALKIDSGAKFLIQSSATEIQRHLNFLTSQSEVPFAEDTQSMLASLSVVFATETAKLLAKLAASTAEPNTLEALAQDVTKLSVDELGADAFPSE